MRRNANKYLHGVGIVLIFVAVSSFFVLLAAKRNSKIAEWLTLNMGYPVRRALASLTNFIPFSVAELLIFLSPLIVIAVLVAASNKQSVRERLRFISGLLAVLSIFYSSYVFTLGVAYHRIPLEDRLGFGDHDINSESLYETINIVKKECEAYVQSVEFGKAGSSLSPLTFDEISYEIVRAYSLLEEQMPSVSVKSFDSRAKEVGISRVLTGFEISGIYSFFSGEANVNTYYPDYVIPFTIAHELAHQRGIAKENEANFIAFLVCIRAENDYIRYSAYMNMFEYLASALASADKEKLREVYSELDPGMYSEMRAFSEFYKANKNELMAKISDFMNDRYLKANGTEGVVSYGLVVELAVAYYFDEWQKTQ